jgi:hypothetical protein
MDNMEIFNDEHKHDDRYYEQIEADRRFCTRADIDAILSRLINNLIGEGKLIMEHHHDDEYYKKSEIDSKYYTSEQCDTKFVTYEYLEQRLTSLLAGYYTKEECHTLFGGMIHTGGTGGSGGTGAAYTGGTGGIIPLNTVIGVFGYGSVSAGFNSRLEFISFKSLNSSIHFGDISVNRRRKNGAALSNGSYGIGVFCGGYDGNVYFDFIDYINITRPTSPAIFGTLGIQKAHISATSNRTGNRGLIFGGTNTSDPLETIEYISINSPGNALPFSELVTPRYGSSAVSNTLINKALCLGGYDDRMYYDSIETCSFDNNSVSSEFNTLSFARGYHTSISSGGNDRCVSVAGVNTYDGYLESMEYCKISDPSFTSLSFGDITAKTTFLTSTSNQEGNVGVISGGYLLSTSTSRLEYINIHSPGNAVHFGNLIAEVDSHSGTSNA